MKSIEELHKILDEMMKVASKYHLLNIDLINIFMIGLSIKFSECPSKNSEEVKYMILKNLRETFEKINKLEK